MSTHSHTIHFAHCLGFISFLVVTLLLCITPATTGAESITAPSVITIYIDGSIPPNGTIVKISAIPAPTATPHVLPPVAVQPFTTSAIGAFPSVQGPLPLPTQSAWFPQNISSCIMCYGQFQTLSRCNVIANSGVFPVTPNTTYADLMPFLKCICSYKALSMYPYCIDCFNQTQQLNQLNVLQAYHLENYQEAFRQLCGATVNGNRIPGSAVAIHMWPRASRLYFPFAQLSLAVTASIASFYFS
ncbi:hypothetical protein BGW41_001343 [Actinomortierella wolfii]|nr:hypothetical protein BGW41_001343 [Actinomortierella wolfii]